ncbi:MAG TPA: RagB/SusD family nutrient uptake outer membrane protein [Bacteroidales bacterium]|nr:RagB/SusD family nutrient uptake outer membrane protein [Bacteroidales bacterium]
MKKWLKYASLVIGLIFFSGCTEWLQLEPESELTREEFWQSGADVQAVVAGTYKELAGCVERLFKWGEIRADLVVPGQNISEDDRKIMEGFIYPENDLNRWNQLYRVINFANTVLKFSPLVVDRDQTFTENESKAFEAEALFLRSLCYFYLVRIFGDVPLVLEASENDAQDFYPPVTSQDDIFLQIIDDLNIAVVNLPTSYAKTEYNKGRATKSAAYSLLADVYLYFEKYQASVNACDEVINSGLYGLIDGEDWFMNFFPGNSNESIFEIQFDKDLNQTNMLYRMMAPAIGGSYPDGNDEFRVSPFFVIDFEENPGDRRAGNRTYFEFSGGGWYVFDKTYILWKYVGTESTSGVSGGGAAGYRMGNKESDAHWIIYRYPDILLMKAEALVQMNQFSEAIDLINMVKTRALLDPISGITNKNMLEDMIMEERAREFCGEGKRWFDLVRMARRNNGERINRFIEILADNKSYEKAEIIRSKYLNPYSWYLPIHQDEIDQNNKLVQNPYYINQ